VELFGRPSRWRIAMAVLILVGIALVGLAPSADADIWWHLAAGREMVRSRALLTVDPFSVGTEGRPWANVHWVFQLGVYAVYLAGGLTAVVAMKTALIAVGALILGISPERQSRFTGALFACLLLGALLVARNLLLVRPVVATLVFLAIFFYELERCRRERTRRALFVLPVVQVLWANCQGLFALGSAVVAAYAVGAFFDARYGDRTWFSFAPEQPSRAAARAHARLLMLVFGACALCSFVTPYGISAASLPLKLFERLLPTAGNPYAAQVAENIPPFTLERLVPGQCWHFPWFLGLLAVSFAIAGRRVVLSHCLVVGGFVMLALMSNRNVLLLYWMATPIAAMNLGPSLDRAASSGFAARRVLDALLLATIAGILSLAGVASAREAPIARPAPFGAPIESAKIIAERGGEGTVFATDNYGGYLIWALYPRFRPYIDTRLVLRTPEEFTEYLELADVPERFDAFHRAHGFSYVVLPVVYPDRYQKLAAHLYASPGWKLIFTNGAEVLFARGDRSDDDAWDLGRPQTTDQILAAHRQAYGSSALLDAARTNLATLQILAGELSEADRVVAASSLPEARALRARAKLAAGDLQGAESIGRSLLALDTDNVGALDLLALVHERRGEHHEAVALLRRVISLDPYDSEATGLIAEMEGIHDLPSIK